MSVLLTVQIFSWVIASIPYGGGREALELLCCCWALDASQFLEVFSLGPNPSQGFSNPKVGARGFPLRLISSLGVRGGGLARIQNCSAGGRNGGVQPNYRKNSKKNKHKILTTGA